MRVLVTVKAASEADARQISQNIPNFTPDPTWTPISFVTGEWILAGTWSGPLPPNGTVDQDPGVQLPPPDADVQ